MADGRMLKKAICTSRKLAALKTDTARLLYTWILPHLDIEGRFFADPDIIKGSIVPRVKNITPEIIEDCLEDMQENNLLIIYQANGDCFLEYTKFSDHQYLRKDREKPSEIPNPPEVAGLTPEASSLKEGKLREVNIKKQEKTIQEKELLAHLKELSDGLYKEGVFKEAPQFKNACLKSQFYPEAIVLALTQIAKHRPREPYPYGLKIVNVENGNFREKNQIERSNRFKEELGKILDSPPADTGMT